MAIFNRRFKIKFDKRKSKLLLDQIMDYFDENLSEGNYPIRWAIVKVEGKGAIKEAVIEATILEEGKLS